MPKGKKGKGKGGKGPAGPEIVTTRQMMMERERMMCPRLGDAVERTERANAIRLECVNQRIRRVVELGRDYLDMSRSSLGFVPEDIRTTPELTNPSAKRASAAACARPASRGGCRGQRWTRKAARSRRGEAATACTSSSMRTAHLRSSCSEAGVTRMGSTTAPTRFSCCVSAPTTAVSRAPLQGSPTRNPLRNVFLL